MTDTIARDWDREEAKTKGGGAFVCLTINVRHSFISSEDSCPVFDMLMVWRVWGSDPWLELGRDTGLTLVRVQHLQSANQGSFIAVWRDARQASTNVGSVAMKGRSLRPHGLLSICTLYRGGEWMRRRVNHSWEEADDGQGQAQWSVIPRYKHPWLISILARGNPAPSSITDWSSTLH